MHRNLLGLCRTLLGEDKARAEFYDYLEGLLCPWLTLGALERADHDLLAALYQQCRRVDWELNGKGWERMRRMILPLVLFLLVAGGVILLSLTGNSFWESVTERLQEVQTAVARLYRQSTETQRLVAFGMVVAAIGMAIAWRTSRH
jgi:hypothetical protein